MNSEYQIILFYKLVHLDETEKLRKWQWDLAKKLDLKGRVLIAEEGINGTLEGKQEDIEKYIAETTTQPEFADILFKKSPGTGSAFPKISIKVRDEVVTLHSPVEYKSYELTANFITSEELHKWFKENREFYILDLRNDYELKVGKFEKTVQFSKFGNFRELPALLPEIEHLKDKTVVTVCTGGIRCEKGTGLLLKSGFKNVYQLQDGIVTYMEKFPNQDFLGKLYVFDKRLVMGFNLDSPEHKIIGKCDLCGTQSENIIDYWAPSGIREHGIVCEECVAKGLVRVD